MCVGDSRQYFKKAEKLLSSIKQSKTDDLNERENNHEQTLMSKLHKIVAVTDLFVFEFYDCQSKLKVDSR